MPPAPVAVDLTSRERCSDCGIRQRAVCSYCAEPELLRLDGIKTYRSFGPGREIVGAGEPMRQMGAIVAGVAQLSRLMLDGRRQMVGLLFPSDFIGRPGRGAAAYDVTAVTEARLRLFERKRFEGLLEEMPMLERRLLHMTLDELDAARDWMLLLGRKTAREKLASFIALLARRAAALENGAPRDGEAVELLLSRDQIGEFLGLTIETVSRQMTAMRKDKVIELAGQRRVIVPDYAALLDAAGDDAEGGVIA